MSRTDWKSLFREAAEIAASVPETMHEAAFNRALDLVLQERGVTPPEVRQEQPQPPSRDGEGQKEQDRIAKLTESLDRTRYPEIMTASTILERSLIVLKAAREHGIEGGSPKEIARLLTDKFRVKTSAAAVSMALGTAGDKVDRVLRGKGFVYLLMAPGETYLQSSGSASGMPTRTTTRRTKRSGGRAASPVERQADQPGNVRGRRADGRPGPKSALEGLIGTGFFTDWRTSGDIREHLEQAQGRRYKSTDISPALVRLLRGGKLDRRENPTGDYEYKSH